MIAGFAAFALASAARGGHYADALLAREAKQHPTLRYAAIDLGDQSAGPFEFGRAQSRAKPIAVPLCDGVGDRIGTLTLEFSNPVPTGEAAAIARDISRRAYAPNVLGEPEPFVERAFRSQFGQALVERELRWEPDLVTIALHVALPKRHNEIIASNFGRIGKAADSDDRHVISDSVVLQEETNQGRRLAVELPLLDRAGRNIGALSTSFLIGSGGRRAAYRSAIRVQHDLSRSIAGLESLQH